MKGVGSVPPPFNEALRKGGTYRLFQKKTNDRLKARLSDITPGFGGKLLRLVPLNPIV